MRRVFILNDTIRVPGALVLSILPAAISLALFAAYSIICSIILGPSSDFNFLLWLPYPISIAVVSWGVYTGVASVALWFLMWAYWGMFDKSSKLARAGWFVVLLFGMHFGALAYLTYIWSRGFLRIESANRQTPGSSQNAAGEAKD